MLGTVVAVLVWQHLGRNQHFIEIKQVPTTCSLGNKEDTLLPCTCNLALSPTKGSTLYLRVSPKPITNLDLVTEGLP